MSGDPMDAIEIEQGLSSLALMCRQVYGALLTQGFTRKQAMRLTRTWLYGMTAGSSAGAQIQRQQPGGGDV